MRAPLSIVIPTLNAEGDLPATLSALGPGLEAGLIRELIISDGGSSDATRAVADAAGAVWVSGAAGRGGQLARGAEAAEGPWLLFLHADTQLGPNWATCVLSQMSASRPGVFRLGFRAKGLAAAAVAGWANLRTRVFALPYGDQGLLISRADYDRLGGFPDLPLMEDVAIARAMGRRFDLMAETAWTSAERYQREGWMRRGARNLWTLARYMTGSDVDTLARSYRRKG